MLLPPRTDRERALLRGAKARLDRLGFYPEPVRMRHVRIVSAPCVFRVPGMRRFWGYECGPLILTRRPLDEVSEDLIVHELCHVWQDQHRRARMWLSYLVLGYRANPHEVEAREAVRLTRAPASAAHLARAPRAAPPSASAPSSASAGSARSATSRTGRAAPPKRAAGPDGR